MTLHHYLTTLTPKFTVYLCALLVYGLAGLYFGRKGKLARPFNLMAAYLLFMFALELISHGLALVYSNNFPTYNVASWVQAAFIGYIYVLAFDKKYRILISTIATLCVAYCVFNSLFMHGFQKFPANSIMAISFMAVAFSLFHFRVMLTYPNQRSLFKEPMFWMNTGHLIFFSLNFFFWSVIGTKFELQHPFYFLLFLTNIIMYTAYFIAMWLQRIAAK